MAAVMLPALGAQSQTTQPSTQKLGDGQTAQAARLVEMIIAVSDPDARVRETARRELLGLSVRDLPRLREAARQLPGAVAAAPATSLILHDAVVHIRLREVKEQLVASRPREERSHMPFLGVQLAGDNADQGVLNANGIPIRSTMPGFVAYETLEDGDLLIAVRTERGLTRLNHFGDLRNEFYSLSPGDPVEFLVVRGGHVLRIALRLDERAERDEGPIGEWNLVASEAKRAAEAYWDEHFAPLLSRQGNATAAVR